MEYTNVKREEGMNEEELRAIGWKKCTSCLEMRPPELYYKSKRVDGKTYVCKLCHRKAVRSYRKVPESYAWYYRRIEKMRSHARTRGLDFTLTVDEYRAIKKQTNCSYCGAATDVITLDRVDNNIGYVKENMVGCCWICNKIKSNLPFTLSEMKLIGQAVAECSKRINRDPNSQSSKGKVED